MIIDAVVVMVTPQGLTASKDFIFFQEFDFK